MRIKIKTVLARHRSVTTRKCPVRATRPGASLKLGKRRRLF